MPNELIEAARIDGASEVRIFFVLGLRIMTPALVTVFLFQFVGIWNNFFLPLIMLTDENLQPVTLGIYNWTADYRHPEIAHLAIARVVPLRGAAHDRDSRPAALLARRPHPGERQGMTADDDRPGRIRARFGGLGYGGDYNPEQWAAEVRVEDIEMRRAIHNAVPTLERP